MIEIPDRWIEITMRHDATYRIAIGHLEQLENLYRDFVEQVAPTGVHFAKDRVMEVTLLAGDTMMLPMSSIGYYTVSSKDGWQKHIEYTKAFRDSRKSIDPEFD